MIAIPETVAVVFTVLSLVSKEIEKFWYWWTVAEKRSKIMGILLGKLAFSYNIFTMVEENFEF